MISLSRLNGKEFYVNPDLIEFLEETPDTVITLTTGRKIVTLESAKTVIARIIEYRQLCAGKLPRVVDQIP